ncbi:AMP-dependent synthetase OS=Streptomyces microflavus OX=1919 GN=Smic_67680 PE=3 SV=1 [Streptomyces microflavus]
MSATSATETFRAARDFLLEHREDYERAYEGFRWPRADHFTGRWTGSTSSRRTTTAPPCTSWRRTAGGGSFAAMSERSDRAANWLKKQGIREGDRIPARPRSLSRA